MSMNGFRSHAPQGNALVGSICRRFLSTDHLSSESAMHFLQKLVPDGRSMKSANSNSETDSLLPSDHYGSVEAVAPIPKATHTGLARSILLGFLIFLLGYSLNFPLNSYVHDGQRREWLLEVRQHEIASHNMEIKRFEWDAERLLWYSEKRERQEENRYEREQERRRRSEAIREMEELRRELDSEKKAMEEENRHEREQEIMRRDLAFREMEELRRKWDLEKKDKQEEERRQLEVRESKRQGISWQGLQAQSCMRYRTREYTATLSNVSIGLDAMQECATKSITIHGRDVLPSKCTNEGFCGKIIGHWEVDFAEPGCTPWFEMFEDKGCVQPGVHRYNGKLENIQDWDNWEKICATMPANIGHLRLDSPTSCSACNQGRCGYWAIWMVDDPACTSMSLHQQSSEIDFPSIEDS